MNRPVTRESYAHRLNRVAEHIWAHLDEPLDLTALAQVACLSPFHFHRIYKTMIGETVIETVSRLRLQRALAGVTVGPEVETDDTVTIHDVAAGRYAVLLYRGPYARIGQGYEELFAWLPASGEEPAHAPCVEVNLNDPRKTAPADLLTELCLPLK